MRLVAIVALLCAWPGSSGAAPAVLRIASVAPEGTAWARIIKAMARELETGTHGELTAKWYLGGIAGDELEMLDRVKRGQLDGILSGGMACMRLAPSMRVLRLLGMFQSRAESAYVVGLLRPTLDAEFLAAGFHNAGEGGLGSDLIFSRTPVANLTDLRRARLWVWDADEVLRTQLDALGVQVVPLPVGEAAHAYETRQANGFIAIPTAALAFQWSAQSSYVTELRLGFITGCLVIANRAFDALSLANRKALSAAAARLSAQFEDLGATQDAELLERLFARQGVKTIPPSATFVAEFFEAARGARQALRDRLVSGALLDRVAGWLADFRSEHPVKSGRR